MVKGVRAQGQGRVRAEALRALCPGTCALQTCAAQIITTISFDAGPPPHAFRARMRA